MSLPFTTADLGFADLGPDGGWQKQLVGRTVSFRVLRALAELLPVEELQAEVFGVSSRDLAAASQLVVVQETGGDVLGAFLDGELVGFSIGWGGFMNRQPRFVSDMLGVRADSRRLGLATELKKLQGAIALARAFPVVVWTADPLRAANARLNFEKLGAFADRYEEDRYGAGYASGLYGGLPTDRLHVTWPLTSPRVRDRLLGHVKPLQPADVAGPRHFDPTADEDRALVFLPDDIDLLLSKDPGAAMRWRLILREALELAFAQGFAFTGFVSDVDAARGLAAYLIERPVALDRPES